MKVYLVGGAVRDELLGLPVKERDYVVVGATPGPSGFHLKAGANLCDTHGVSAANPDGSTVAAVMQQALDAAGLAPADILAVKAHGTASLLNDEAEAAGMHRVFPAIPPMLAMKPFIGHTFGACGLNELLLVCGAIGTLVLGPVADRVGLRRTLLVTQAALPFLVVTFVAVGGVAGTIALMLVGPCVVGTFGVTMVLSQLYLPRHVGVASGLSVGLAMGLGGIAAVLLGAVADAVDLQTALYVAAAAPEGRAFFGRVQLVNARGTVAGVGSVAIGKVVP